MKSCLEEEAKRTKAITITNVNMIALYTIRGSKRAVLEDISSPSNRVYLIRVRIEIDTNTIRIMMFVGYCWKTRNKDMNEFLPYGLQILIIIKPIIKKQESKEIEA